MIFLYHSVPDSAIGTLLGLAVTAIGAAMRSTDAYDGLKDWEYRHHDALDQATGEIEWFVDEFRQLAEDWGIAQYEENDGDIEVVNHNVRAVEQYVVDELVGASGAGSDADEVVVLALGREE